MTLKIGKSGGGNSGLRFGTWNHFSEGVARTVYTYANATLGEPSDDRYICVIAEGADSATSFTANSVTVGGVSAVKATEYPASGMFYNQSMWLAKVPSGTTGDVVVTYSESLADGVYIQVLPIYGLTSTTAADETSGFTTSDAGSRDFTIDTRSSGVTVIYAAPITASTPHPTTTMTAIGDGWTVLDNEPAYFTAYVTGVPDTTNNTLTATFSKAFNELNWCIATFI